MARKCGRTVNTWTTPKAYEGYIGRWSRVAAGEFLAWLDVPPRAVWLDVGCGTGELTRAILEERTPSAIDGFDLSESYVQYAREKTIDPRASFEVADAQALPCANASYDVAVAGLCLNTIPDQARAIAEMMRAVKPGGTVAAYVWDFDGGMQMLRHFWDSVEALYPGTADPVADALFAICRPGPLAELYRAGGMLDVEVRAIDAPTNFTDFDDYWTPFLQGAAPAQRYTAALSVERRSRLRDRVRASLPIAQDGSISLIARAWAVKGTIGCGADLHGRPGR